MYLARVKELGSAKGRIEQIASGKLTGHLPPRATRYRLLQRRMASRSTRTLPYAFFSLFAPPCETLQEQSKVEKSLLASFRRTSLSHGSLQNQTA
jgi:hypothetical protein